MIIKTIKDVNRVRNIRKEIKSLQSELKNKKEYSDYYFEMADISRKEKENVRLELKKSKEENKLEKDDDKIFPTTLNGKLKMEHTSCRGHYNLAQDLQKRIKKTEERIEELKKEMLTIVNDIIDRLIT